MTMETKMKELHAEMVKMPDQMKQFTIGMRAMYAGKAVSEQDNDPDLKQFREIRDDTRKDAIVYRDLILPKSKDFMVNLSEYCYYYQALEYEEWAESLDDIVQEVREHKDMCVLLLNLLKNLIVPLKKREDKAETLSPTFENLKKKYLEKSEEMKGKGHTNTAVSTLAAWGLAVGGVALTVATAGVGALVVGAVATLGSVGNAFYVKYSKEQIAKSVAFAEQAKVLDLAILCLSKTLIPALKNFVEGLNTAAGVFSLLETELVQLQRRGEKAVEDPKKLHYRMMKKHTETIQKDCKAFLVVLPNIETDLAALPTDNMDKNYVDEWLEKQMKEIKKSMFNDFKAICAKVTGSMVRSPGAVR